jgi:anthranilate/para-aminobenzoate synthase component II
MGLRRVWGAGESGSAPVEGVQFHPESFLTDEGPALLRNFLAM